MPYRASAITTWPGASHLQSTRHTFQLAPFLSCRNRALEEITRKASVLKRRKRRQVNQATRQHRIGVECKRLDDSPTSGCPIAAQWIRIWCGRPVNIRTWRGRAQSAPTSKTDTDHTRTLQLGLWILFCETHVTSVENVPFSPWKLFQWTTKQVRDDVLLSATGSTLTYDEPTVLQDRSHVLAAAHDEQKPLHLHYNCHMHKSGAFSATRMAYQTYTFRHLAFSAIAHAPCAQAYLTVHVS